jgi:ATP-binding cassette subfamily B multidrug efflux pump
MDRLIVLDHGRIVEQGDHRSLLARDGIYARLWAHQSGGFLGDDVAEATAGAVEAIAAARGESEPEEPAARRPEPTLIGHDLPAGPEP